MADLKIVITALNKASQGLKDLQGDVKSVGDKADDATKKMGGFDLKNVAMGLTAAAVARAIVKVGDALVDTVNDWSDYNIEVDKGATATGMAAEEYSRLIQAADDARVSQEAMTTALEMATKNGYPMNIQKLGELADQLKAIEDPSEKAEKATKIFGRGWADIMPLLAKGSDGIDALTAAIDDNMVATKESIAASQEYATQVDNMQDAWTGFKNEIGAGVMPVLTDVLTSLVDQITQIKILKSNMDILKGGVEAGTISQEDYADAALAANWSTEAGVYATDKLVASLGNSNEKVDEGASLMGDYAQSAAIMKAYTENAAIYEAELAKQIAETSAKFRDQKSAVTSLDKNFGGIIGLAKNFDKALEEIVKQEDIMAKNPIGSEKYNEAKDKVDELKESMADLANQVVLDMFQATIAIGGITEAEADAYFKMAEDMGLISEGAAQAAIEAYGNAIDTINGMKIDDKTGHVSIDVDDSEYRNWKPADFVAYIKMKRDSMEIDKWLEEVHYTTVKLKMVEEQRAAGGPVSGGSPYIVGERGPELFVPASNGYIVNHSEAQAALSAAARSNSGGGSGAMGSGNMTNVTNNYNLTMPTSSNPADVRTAFELMEAWA